MRHRLQRAMALAAIAAHAACGPLQDAREVTGDSTQADGTDTCARWQAPHLRGATITPSAFPGVQQLTATFDDGSSLRVQLPAVSNATQGMPAVRPTRYTLPGPASVQFTAFDGAIFNATAGQIDGATDGAAGDSLTLLLSAISLRSPARTCSLAGTLTLQAAVVNPPCSSYGLSQAGDGCYVDPSTGDNAVLTCAPDASVTAVKYCRGVNQTCQADATAVVCRSKN